MEIREKVKRKSNGGKGGATDLKDTGEGRIRAKKDVWMRPPMFFFARDSEGLWASGGAQGGGQVGENFLWDGVGKQSHGGEGECSTKKRRDRAGKRKEI